MPFARTVTKGSEHFTAETRPHRTAQADSPRYNRGSASSSRLAAQEIREAQATRNEIEEAMADWLSREQRSRNMASIRSKGNATTEQVFLHLLRQAGIHGWRRHVGLPGKPDFLFRAQRVAVFIDGCFWHGCPRCYRMPGDHRPYWKAKLSSNRRRDRRTTRKLRSLGWRVIRIWEHSLKSPLARTRAVARLSKALQIR